MRKLLLNAQALADAATRPGRPFPDGSVCCCNPWHPRPKNRTLDIELDPIIKARRAVHLRRPLPLPPPKSSTVVASLVWNYELEFFRIYVLSLRAHYDGDIVLLMYAKPPDDVLQFILEQRVTQARKAQVPPKVTPKSIAATTASTSSSARGASRFLGDAEQRKRALWAQWKALQLQTNAVARESREALYLEMADKSLAAPPTALAADAAHYVDVFALHDDAKAIRR